MASLHRIFAWSRWLRVAVSVSLFAMLIAACSLLLDRNTEQCNADKDCESFPGVPLCQDHVCVATSLGPPGCFNGTPTTPEQFANQCSTAQCEKFDNCTRLGMCTTGASLPPLIPQPPPDAGTPIDGSQIDAAPPPQLIDCVDPGHTVTVVGSTAIQPFIAVVAPLLAQNSPPYKIAYQPSGSCAGVDNLFSTDPAKHTIKDIAGKQALLYHSDGGFEPCTFSNVTPNLADVVAASDVYASSCTASYATGANLSDYPALIQPMTFVVPGLSLQKAISAELGHIVFGRGAADPHSDPFIQPKLYFIRNSGSGTQQMLSRAISVDAKSWWGIDKGSSGSVRDAVKQVDQKGADQAIGILSTDFADPARDQLKILAFQGAGQGCGYYPDSSQNTYDKANVRDGHYAIWGPEHFYAQTVVNSPSEAAGAFVSRFSLPRIDTPLLDAIIKAGLIPPCAMKVQRTTEMGPISAYAPTFQCGCYFEANVTGGDKQPAGCQTCVGAGDCPADKPACNLGYCEAKP